MSPFQSSRMTWRASASISCRTSIDGHRCPSTCSLRRLAGADAEEEAALEEQGRRCCRMGDDRRVDAQDRAGHAGPDADGRRRLGHPAEDRPHERAVALLVDPRVEVVRDGQEVEARLLGQARMAHQVGRSVLLTGECVAPRGHGPSSTPDRVRVNRRPTLRSPADVWTVRRSGYSTTKVVSAARGPPASGLRSPLSRRVLSSTRRDPVLHVPAAVWSPVLGRFPA